jgi:hypothetical protein
MSQVSSGIGAGRISIGSECCYRRDPTPKTFGDPKLRSADLALRLMTTTAEHLRDCPRCYEILARRAGEKLGEIIAAKPVERQKPEGLTGAHTEDRLILMPSKLWPLLAELYPEFVRCECWPYL